METINDRAVGLEIRSVEIRSVDADKREITGLAVPYNQTTNIGGYNERFEPGAFGKAEDVKLFYGHSEPIGLVTKGIDTADGYEITARISETQRGNEVYTLMKDGVLNRFSVGFLPVEHRMEEDTVVRTKATLKEVSVVAFPAYEGAKVSEVREASDENKNEKEAYEDMSNEVIESEVADLRDRTEDLERRFTTLGESTEGKDSAPQYRLGGEFIKALASNEREARDFATLTSNATPAEQWVPERLRLQAENRQITNLFSKGTLPAEGMTVTYNRVSGTAGTVGVQAAEGDALPYMEVTFDTASADVETYGGYASLSRQVIERSTVPALETTLDYMARQYAKATEKAVRDAFVAGTGYNTGTLASDDAEGWIDLVVDSVDLIENNSKGSHADFILVSSDVYKRLAHMVDGQGRPLFSIAGQSVNSLGAANPVSGSLNVAGLTVIKASALAANSTFVASSDAVKVWESAGAPFALTDDDIIHLTKDFSLYGYLAVGVTNPLSVVKVDVDLVA
jgi:HK97 family phage prohead protease